MGAKNRDVKCTDGPLGIPAKVFIMEGTRQSSSLRAGGSPVTIDQPLSTANTCASVDMGLSLYDPPDEEQPGRWDCRVVINRAAAIE